MHQCNAACQNPTEFLLAEAPVNTLYSLTEGMTNLLSSWLGLRSKWEVKRHSRGSDVRGFLKEKRKQSLCRGEAAFPFLWPVQRDERTRWWNSRQAFYRRRSGSTFGDVLAKEDWGLAPQILSYRRGAAQWNLREPRWKMRKDERVQTCLRLNSWLLLTKANIRAPTDTTTWSRKKTTCTKWVPELPCK